MILSPCCQRLATSKGFVGAELANIAEVGLRVMAGLQTVAMGLSNLPVFMKTHE
ncbi:hypothetical protein D3C86_1871670 [compost metagenome]